jgi:hypothetical protein
VDLDVPGPGKRTFKSDGNITSAARAHSGPCRGAAWQRGGRGRGQAAVAAGLAVAGADGFAFLGACNPRCADHVFAARQVAGAFHPPARPPGPGSRLGPPRPAQPLGPAAGVLRRGLMRAPGKPPSLPEQAAGAGDYQLGRPELPDGPDTGLGSTPRHSDRTVNLTRGQHDYGTSRLVDSEWTGSPTYWRATDPGPRGTNTGLRLGRDLSDHHGAALNLDPIQ